MQGLANTSKNGLRYKSVIAQNLVARRVRFGGFLDFRDQNCVGSLIERFSNDTYTFLAKNIF